MADLLAGMSLWSSNCRLMQRAGDRPFLGGRSESQECRNRWACQGRSQRLPMATPSLRFLLSRICWKAGAVSRARGFCAEKRPLDTTPPFHRMSMESEGEEDAERLDLGRFHP